jgi:hypothetical protein
MMMMIIHFFQSGHVVSYVARVRVFLSFILLPKAR